MDKPKQKSATEKVANTKQASTKTVPSKALQSAEVEIQVSKSALDHNLSSPQDAPVVIKGLNKKAEAALMLDSVKVNGFTIEVQGWCVGDYEITFIDKLKEINPIIKKSKRPDVAEILKVPEPKDGFGFNLRAKVSKGKYVLRWKVKISGSTNIYDFNLKVSTSGDLSQATKSINAKGFLEACSASPATGAAAVVGWVVASSDVDVYLEDDEGWTYPIDNAFYYYRQDVLDAVGNSFEIVRKDAGVIASIGGLSPGGRIKLMADDGEQKVELASTLIGSLPLDSVAAAKWLFGIGTPLSELSQRIPLVDEPLINSLTVQQCESWKTLPVTVHEIGQCSQTPEVSIIIPLYGRTDFVEHQLIEFSQDPWVQKHAEIIYVIDDPKLTDGFISQALTLYRLYKIPFKWVWGNVNRGFSGANNLGVEQSKGKYLLFLNSDAFPREAGWLERLIDVLKNNPRVGVVGPRLLFGDGSIQHAGMEFLYREELGIWINHHPNMGIDPSLDPHTELTNMPAITGACMAMRRVDFDKVGGWDTGYLIGDFEDSDLCFKLRDAGFELGYLPTVQLTHLERQSFKLLGQSEFRTRVVIYNGTRHQNRWAKLLEQSVSSQNR